MALPGLISIPFLCVVGLITLITYVGFNFVNNKKKQINEYLKKKNRVNLSIILKKIYDIFVEEKYKDFFEKNNIYIFAYDANIIWHKNAGATFFGKYFPFDPPGVDGGKNDIIDNKNEDKIDEENKYPKRLVKNDDKIKDGFNIYSDEEKTIYETYLENIEEIRNFFKKNKERFKKLKQIRDDQNLNDENYSDIKEIIIDLIRLNQKYSEDSQLESNTSEEFDNKLENLPAAYKEEIKDSEEKGRKKRVTQLEKTLEENNNLKQKLDIQKHELNEEKLKHKEKEKEYNKILAEKKKEIKDLKDKLAKEQNNAIKEKKIEEENKKLNEEKLKEAEKLKEEKLKEIEKLKEEKLKEIEKLKEEKLKEIEKLKEEGLKDIEKIKKEYIQKNKENEEKDYQLKIKEMDLNIKILDIEEQNNLKEKQFNERENDLKKKEAINEDCKRRLENYINKLKDKSNNSISSSSTNYSQIIFQNLSLTSK